MGEINERLAHRRESAGFTVGNTNLKIFNFAREPTDVHFRDQISYLYQVFWEGARRHGQYRLPGALGEKYKGARVVKEISDLRNYFEHNHDQDRDDETPNSAHVEAGEIFLRRCSATEPVTDDQRMMVLQSIYKELLELLQDIYDCLDQSPPTSEPSSV